MNRSIGGFLRWPAVSRLFVGLTVYWCGGTAVGAAAGFFLHQEDSPTVFLGDSITDQGRYTTLIESFILTRFPEWSIRFRNVGWSGDTASLSARGRDFETALTEDVLALRPRVVMINYGMNDARAGETGYPGYLDRITTLVKRIQTIGARPILLSPSPREGYEANQPGGSGYNHLLRQYTQGLELVSRQQQVLVIDELNPFLRLIASGRQAGVLGLAGPPRLTDDLHPNWPGALIMASRILECLGATPTVSWVEINASTRAVVSVENCKAEVLPSSPNNAETTLTFRRTDRCLPWPMPKDVEPALHLPGFDPVTALNQYGLRVTGLAPGRYWLTIDGRSFAVVPAERLAAGVNLAAHSFLIFAEQQQLLESIQEKNLVFIERWRIVQVKGQLRPGEERQAKLAELDRRIAAIENRTETLRQPTVHLFTITREPEANNEQPPGAARP